MPDFDETMRRDPGSAAAREAAGVAAGPIIAVPPAPPETELTKPWRSVRERGDWLEVPPRTRRYLLSTRLNAGTGKPSVGVLPLGKVGMLAAAGGVGKTWVLNQLALSVATGRDLMGTFEVSTPGHVLLVLGEEDEEEMHRRLYRIGQALGLDAAERRRAGDRIIPLPLSGVPARLTYSSDELRAAGIHPDTPDAEETPVAREFRQRLVAMDVEWSLIIFDPISRFAGPDVEVDNAAATRLVQFLERLTAVPGTPTVLVAHHTNKMSRTGTTTAAAARGSSGLTDGVRWQANLDALHHPSNPQVQVPGMCVFRVVKNNYGWYLERPLWLQRDEGGVIRPATVGEIQDYAELKAQAAAEKRAAKDAARAKPAGGAANDDLDPAADWNA